MKRKIKNFRLSPLNYFSDESLKKNSFYTMNE
jgi:hypothetical protein